MTPGGSLKLPFPPSANAIWRSVRGKVVKSEAYKAWLTEAGWELKAQRPEAVKGPYRLSLYADRPDRRLRDIDNLVKPTSDLLAACGVIENDHLAKSIFLAWTDAEPAKGACIHVNVVEV